MKRFSRLASAAVLCGLLLSGCTAGSNVPPPPPPQSAVPDAEKDTPTLLADHYLDVQSLPAVQIDVQPEYVFDDRSLALEDTVDSQLELLVFGYYYAESSGDIDPQLEVTGGKTLRQALENTRRSLDEGLYMQQYVIHQLNTLTAAETAQASEFTQEYIREAISQYGLYRFAIVEADLDWTYNDRWKEQGSQLDDGRYHRYFLVGNTREQPLFQLYDVFWEDFFPMSLRPDDAPAQAM